MQNRKRKTLRKISKYTETQLDGIKIANAAITGGRERERESVQSMCASLFSFHRAMQSVRFNGIELEYVYFAPLGKAQRNKNELNNIHLSPLLF